VERRLTRSVGRPTDSCAVCGCQVPRTGRAGNIEVVAALDRRGAQLDGDDAVLMHVTRKRPAAREERAPWSSPRSAIPRVPTRDVIRPNAAPTSERRASLPRPRRRDRFRPDDRDGLGVRETICWVAHARRLSRVAWQPAAARTLPSKPSRDPAMATPAALGAVPRRSPPSVAPARTSTRARVHASSRTRCSAPAERELPNSCAKRAARARTQGDGRAEHAGTSAPRPPAGLHTLRVRDREHRRLWFAHSHRTFPDAVAEGRGDSGCTPTAHRRRPAEVVAPSPP